MTARRRQLTLFVPEQEARLLEPLRAQVDPVQQRLIAAHVTLCREDELSDDPLALLRRVAVRPEPITLGFGAPQPFDGHGVLLPCIGGQAAFQRLRVAALGSEAIRTHAAHLTLSHPRNPMAPGNRPAAYADLPVPMLITFPAISLIEQVGDGAWELVDIFPLDGRAASLPFTRSSG